MATVTVHQGDLLSALGMTRPIVGAPMAGGPTTPALVAAVSSAGGLGCLAGGYSTPETIRDEIAEVRRRTPRPFGVNLFVTSTEPDLAVPPELVEVIGRLRSEIGLPTAPVRTSMPSPDEQLESVLENPPVLVSWTFGVPPAHAIAAAHAAGCLVGATATTVDEARQLDAAGVDVICSQGMEAGGHRGGFDADGGGLVGTMALVPQVVDAVERPVVAAGGIGDGRSVAAVLALGADAAQVGTALLNCLEAGTAAAHRQLLGSTAAEDTVVTPAVTGKPVRAIRNRLVDHLAAVPLLPYPQLHAWTAELRRAAAEAGRSDLMGMWAGQAAAMASEQPAGELVAQLVDDAMRILRR